MRLNNLCSNCRKPDTARYAGQNYQSQQARQKNANRRHCVEPEISCIL